MSEQFKKHTFKEISQKFGKNVMRGLSLIASGYALVSSTSADKPQLILSNKSEPPAVVRDVGQFFLTEKQPVEIIVDSDPNNLIYLGYDENQCKVQLGEKNFSWPVDNALGLPPGSQGDGISIDCNPEMNMGKIRVNRFTSSKK